MACSTHPDTVLGEKAHPGIGAIKKGREVVGRISNTFGVFLHSALEAWSHAETDNDSSS